MYDAALEEFIKIVQREYLNNRLIFLNRLTLASTPLNNILFTKRSQSSELANDAELVKMPQNS